MNSNPDQTTKSVDKGRSRTLAALFLVAGVFFPENILAFLFCFVAPFVTGIIPFILLLIPVALIFFALPVKLVFLRSEGVSPSRFLTVASTLYFAAAAAYTAFLSLFSLAWGPWFLAAVVVFSVVVAFLAERGAFPRWFVVPAVGAAFLVPWLGFFVFPLYAYLYILRRIFERFPLRVPKPITILGLVALCNALLLAKFIVYTSGDNLKKVLAQKNVSPIFLSRKSPVSKDMGRALYFVAEDCAGENYIVGTRSATNGRHTLEKISKKTGRYSGIFHEPVESPDRPAFDCSRGLIFFGDYKTGDLHILDDKTLREIKKLRFRKQHFTKTIVDEKRAVAYAALDWGDVLRIDYSQFPQLRIKKASVSRIMDVALADGGVVAADNEKIRALDPDTLGVRRRSSGMMGNFSFKIAPLADGKTIFSTNPILGKCYIFRTADLKLIRERRIEQGVRYSLYDPRRKRIYVGNYFNGKVYFLNERTLKIEREYYVGSKIRSLHLSRDGEYLLAPSRLGAFRIRLDG